MKCHSTRQKRCFSLDLQYFKKIFEPIKPSDVSATYVSTDLLEEEVGFKPETTIEELQKFADLLCWVLWVEIILM